MQVKTNLKSKHRIEAYRVCVLIQLDGGLIQLRAFRVRFTFYLINLPVRWSVFSLSFKPSLLGLSCGNI